MKKKESNEYEKVMSELDKRVSEQLEAAFKTLTAEQIDVWAEIYDTNPAAQSALINNPFYKALKKQFEEKLKLLDMLLRKASIEKVTTLQGSITVYESLTELLDYIEKINTKK